MIDYTSRKTVQLQRQYDMLIKSLEFTVDEEEKNNIYSELCRIQKDILDTTEEMYNEEYNKLMNKSTSLLKEEKDRLLALIELIENRRKYVNEQIEIHKKHVMSDFTVPKVLGQEKVVEFQKKIKIIDKYRQNVRLKDKLIKEIDALKDSISKSEAKIRSNDRINKELETKMIETLEKSFKAMEIYSYKEREEEINLAFTELTFAKDKALQNIEVARSANNTTLIVECEKMLDSVTEEYNKYFEKKMLLGLLDIYDRVVNNYDELLHKREEINDILSQISNSDFYKLISGEINKQYNTIKLEQHDLKTFDNLTAEKDTKERLLNEIEEENNSEEFSIVLNNLLRNEKMKHEKEAIEKRKKEYEERQQRLIEESKKQEEVRKRQKVIEEARKRDIEIRTKELLEAKNKTSVNVAPPIDTSTIPVKKDVFFDTQIDAKDDTKVENQDTRDRFVDKILNEMGEDTSNFELKKETKPIEDYDSILKTSSQDLFKEDDEQEDVSNAFAIPVIKNDKFVPKKVTDAKIDEDDVDSFMRKFLEDTKKDEVMEVNDIVFPDMPM